MKKLTITVMVTLLTAVFQTAALDTTEPFDIGFTNIELYGGFGGIGAEKGARSITAEQVIGVGITDRLSASFAYSYESNEYFANSAGGATLGLFATLIDQDVFDLDVAAGVIPGDGITLGTELNADFSTLGLQLAIEESFSNGGADTVAAATALAPLVYWSFSDAAQILAAFDVSFIHSGPEEGTDIGAVAIGFNRVLSDAVELITEASWDIPDDNEEGTLGLSVGFVATVE
ncbi:MAG: hypothetical protein ACQEQ4_07900 [Fibrobacterota bacterium]